MPAPVTFFIAHASPFGLRLGGGELHLRSLLEALKAEVAYVAYPEGEELVLAAVRGGDVSNPLVQRRAVGPLRSRFAFEDSEREHVLSHWLEQTAPSLVHVQSLLNWPLSTPALLGRSGLPYLVTLHDMYAVCPSFHLYDYEKAERCACQRADSRCVTAALRELGERETDVAALRRQHRDAFDALLGGAKAVLFPSASAMGEARRHLGALPHAQVMPFGFRRPGASVATRAAVGERLKVALVGDVSNPIKGARHYLAVAEQLRAEPIEWHVFGATHVGHFETHLRQAAAPNSVVVHGGYWRDGLLPALLAEQVDVAVQLPAVDETYSYVLTECLAVGVPVVALARGALRERLQGQPFGVCVDTVDEVASVVRELWRSPLRLKALQTAAQQTELVSPQAMAAAHRDLYERHAAARAGLGNRAAFQSSEAQGAVAATPDVVGLDVPASHQPVVGPIITAAKRAGLKVTLPLQAEWLRGQQRFNDAAHRAIGDAVARRGARMAVDVSEAVRRALLPLATVTPGAQVGHRRGVAGAVVRWAKALGVSALTPVIGVALEQQARFNAAFTEAIVAVAHGVPLASESAWALSQSVWQAVDVTAARHAHTSRTVSSLRVELWRRQQAFNQRLAHELAALLGVGGGDINRTPQVPEREAQRFEVVARCDVAPVPSRARGAGPIRTMQWFVPHFTHAFAGVHTILRFAAMLKERHGVEPTVVVYDGGPQPLADAEAAAVSVYPQLVGHFVELGPSRDVRQLPSCDLAMATHWRSAYLVAAHPHAQRRGYFVQDFEPLFYPGGTEYGLAEQTYRLGLEGVFNTVGLYDWVTSQYPMKGAWFAPAVDPKVFHARRPQRRGPVRVFFYGRPSQERNAFHLGLLALKQLKQKLGPLVEIVSAGERWSPADYGVEGVVANLGVLPYAQTGELYRTCDIGLCFMFTKHPSYLPLELMACGVAVVSNLNSANDWLLADETTCLSVAPLPAAVALALERLAADEGLRARLASAGAARVSADWETAVDGVWRSLVGES